MVILYLILFVGVFSLDANGCECQEEEIADKEINLGVLEFCFCPSAEGKPYMGEINDFIEESIPDLEGELLDFVNEMDNDESGPEYCYQRDNKAICEKGKQEISNGDLVACIWTEMFEGTGSCQPERISRRRRRRRR